MATPGFANSWNTSFRVSFENGWTVFTSQLDHHPPLSGFQLMDKETAKITKSATVQVVVVDNNWDLTTTDNCDYNIYYWDVVVELIAGSYFNRYKLVAETPATYPRGTYGTQMTPDELARLMVAVSEQNTLERKETTL